MPTPVPNTATPTEVSSPTPAATIATTAEPIPATGPGTLKPDQAVTITQIHMLDTANGWGVGIVDSDLFDHILFTQDGGQTWQDRTPHAALQNAPANGLKAVPYFLSADQVWVAYAPRTPLPNPGDQVVWYTTDGGKNWSASHPFTPSPTEMEFYEPSNLGFLDANNGWLMAHLGVGMSHDYISVFTTDDGGENWYPVLDPQKNPGLMGCTKSGLAFSTPENGWLTGNCPGLMTYLFFYRTTDSGKNWEQVDLLPPEGQPSDLFQQSSLACGIPGLVYTSARNIMLSVRCTDFNNNTSTSWLYVSSDGGLLWTARPLPAPYGSFQFLNPDTGWIVSSSQEQSSTNGMLFQTADNGRNWTTLTPVGWLGTPDFVDPQNAWIVAKSGDSSALVHSVDSGKTWKEIKPTIAQ